MDEKDNGDSVTEVQISDDDVEQGAETETDASDADVEEKGRKKASEGVQKKKVAHNPYNKKTVNGPTVAVAGKSDSKGEEPASPSIEIQCKVSQCKFRNKTDLQAV